MCLHSHIALKVKAKKTFQTVHTVKSFIKTSKESQIKKKKKKKGKSIAIS